MLASHSKHNLRRRNSESLEHALVLKADKVKDSWDGDDHWEITFSEPTSQTTNVPYIPSGFEFS
jgi:hypothetical protein